MIIIDRLIEWILKSVKLHGQPLLNLDLEENDFVFEIQRVIVKYSVCTDTFV